ncbi:hypothetical protein [Mycobacterium sp. DL440]|uniref:hypothetical protein n=1 Tax=Mycobacterium sp. DL440 TaxID=2675523 RepID=UPI00141EA5DA|nr:hypothetical protein [Mycobacterium sp. DL440]
MLILKLALVAFLVAAVAFIVVTGIRRWRKDPGLVDLSDAYAARYGVPMAGNWTPPVEDNVQIVAEEPFGDNQEPR